jgi:hypothetical protein
MQRIAGDAALRARLRLRSLETAKSRDWDRVWDALFAEYARVVTAPEPAIAAAALRAG